VRVTARTYRPVTDLGGALIDVLVEPETTHPLRVAVDGPICADPAALANALLGPLRALGRPSACVRAESFWRDTSLRLEFGRRDPAAFAHDWLDTDALTREVLVPLGSSAVGRYLPSLRDPLTNRVTREPPIEIGPRGIVIVAGGLLLGRSLAFDHTIHLSVSPPARRRRTEPEWQWTLPAFDEYDATVDPVAIADVVVRYDDPVRPAVST
jgi:hypothetical protein